MGSECKNGKWEKYPCLWCDYLQSPFIDWRNGINIWTPCFTHKNRKTMGERLDPHGTHSLTILNGTK